ncbi:RNA-binding S4 domain-containing protein [Xanthomonas theicola]|uniref:RNA-binding protein n=1 Tax=Xanthomonas theicola TaxID=56464 RepID=A0A2S6ZMC1_9XANT|nr:RNA-binding S4 domain-containing protein [Xanthomonas theicola]PPT93394.1 RNA-binding protein [Xanthomonas theicola]QNH25582.1 RNA-binding S4 domain-containing protein [Xanthomonas theicola]
MQTIDLQLESDYVELKHLLKLTGVCDSGGAAKTVIGEGQVRVDGEVELRKACKIHAGQVVALHDVQIRVIGKA